METNYKKLTEVDSAESVACTCGVLLNQGECVKQCTVDDLVNASTFKSDILNGTQGVGKLATPRKINGVDFDGSADISTPSQKETLIRWSPTRITTTGWFRLFGSRLQEYSSNIVFSIICAGSSCTQESAIFMYSRSEYGRSIVQLNSCVAPYYITKIRVLTKGYTDDIVEVFVNVVGNDFIRYEVLNASMGQIVDYGCISGSIPDGYIATEFELSSNPMKASGLDLVSDTFAPLKIKRNDNLVAGIKFENASGVLGYIGMRYVDGTILRLSSNSSQSYFVLDTGNSKPVAIQSTAPSDTTALWAW